MKAKGMKVGGPAKRAKKTARLKKISKALGPQKTKDKTQKMAPQKMQKGGKMMSKGGATGGRRRMNGKKNMGLYGRK